MEPRRSFSVARFPEERSDDLYPGLTLWEARQDGKIVIGNTHLPLSEPLLAAIMDRQAGSISFEEIEDKYPGVDRQRIAEFVEHLLSAPGELGRLLLIIADNDRRYQESNDDSDQSSRWWNEEELRLRLLDQLRRCLRQLSPRRRRERKIPPLAPENERQTVALINLLVSDSAVDAAARALWAKDGYDHDLGPDDDEEHSRYFGQAIAALSGVADQVVEDLGIAENLGLKRDPGGRIIVDRDKLYHYFGLDPAAIAEDKAT